MCPRNIEAEIHHDEPRERREKKKTKVMPSTLSACAKSDTYPPIKERPTKDKYRGLPIHTESEHSLALHRGWWQPKRCFRQRARMLSLRQRVHSICSLRRKTKLKLNSTSMTSWTNFLTNSSCDKYPSSTVLLGHDRAPDNTTLTYNLFSREPGLEPQFYEVGNV